MVERRLYGQVEALAVLRAPLLEPLSVSVEETENDFKIYAINDLREEKHVKVVYKIGTLNGKCIGEKTVEKTLLPLKSTLVEEAVIKSITNKANIYLSVKMFENEKLVSERTKIFVPDRDLKLEKAKIKKDVSYENGVLTVKLLSPVFCRSVMVDIKDFPTPFSDNYFDLLPNEEKVITVEADSLKDVTVKSLADVEVKKDKKAVKLYRLKFALEPLNIGNWFWYSVN